MVVVCSTDVGFEPLDHGISSARSSGKEKEITFYLFYSWEVGILFTYCDMESLAEPVPTNKTATTAANNHEKYCSFIIVAGV